MFKRRRYSQFTGGSYRSEKPDYCRTADIETGFGGPGKFRGGLGVANEVRMRRTATIHAHVERTICAPWGLHGGKDALANRISVSRKDGAVEKFPTGKIKPMEIDTGDSFLIETAGGGGFWSPLERAPERVLDDVRAGYVSL